jgi:hypothetical protein
MRQGPGGQASHTQIARAVVYSARRRAALAHAGYKPLQELTSARGGAGRRPAEARVAAAPQGPKEVGDIDTDDEKDEEAEYEQWKSRELRRIRCGAPPLRLRLGLRPVVRRPGLSRAASGAGACCRACALP